MDPEFELGDAEMEFAARKMEFGSAEMEFGTWEMEFGSPEIEFGSREMEIGDPEMEFGSPEMEFGTQKMEFGSPEIEFGSQITEFPSAQHSFRLRIGPTVLHRSPASSAESRAALSQASFGADPGERPLKLRAAGTNLTAVLCGEAGQSLEARRRRREEGGTLQALVRELNPGDEWPPWWDRSFASSVLSRLLCKEAIGALLPAPLVARVVDATGIGVPGSDNTVNMPIRLLPLDLARGVRISETEGGTVTIPEMPGFSLEIAPDR